MSGKDQSSEVWKMVMRMRKPDDMFDMVILNAWLAGQYGFNIPVEQSRKALEKIKKLLEKK